MKGSKKKDNKSKVQILKKYLNGEKVAELVLDVEPITPGFSFVHALTKERLPWCFQDEPGDPFFESGGEKASPFFIGGKNVGWPTLDEENKTYKLPAKLYPDPTISDVFYSNPDNVPEAPNLPVSSVLIESTEDSESLKNEPVIDRRQKNRENVQQRLREFAIQEKIDLEIREKENIWMDINKEFLK